MANRLMAKKHMAKRRIPQLIVLNNFSFENSRNFSSIVMPNDAFEVSNDKHLRSFKRNDKFFLC